MTILRGLLAVALALATSVCLEAQPCEWTSAAGQITETCGKVGIGTASPLSPLHVIDVGDGTITIRGIHGVHVETPPPSPGQNDYALKFGAYEAVYDGVQNDGELVGVAIEALKVSPAPVVNNGTGTLATTVGSRIISGANVSGTVTTAYGQQISIIKGPGNVGTGYGVFVSDVQATDGWAFYQEGVNDKNYFKGQVGVGGFPGAGYALHVTGNARVDGTLTGTNIQAQYQDLAEWVPSQEDLAPGTVVVLDRAVGNAVVRSSAAYDTTVAGVVSAQPGIILGERGDSKEQVATTGRVRVKVDATAAPIRVGDLLVTSSKPGMAMRSQPVKVGGITMHQPGTIIGKALDALASGEGEILVLLSLQ
jgi:hypothetical protein